MVVFTKIFRLFRKNDAQKELSEVYDELNDISSKLHKILTELRMTHRELVEKMKGKQSFQGSRKVPTGELGLEKTEFIDHLLKQLHTLSTDAEKRFWRSSSASNKNQPVDEEERLEIQKIIKILQKIKNMTDTQYKLIEKKKKITTLDEIYQLEKEITEEFKLIYIAKKEEYAYARKIVENKINPLIKNVYHDAKILSKENPLLAYEIDEKDLRVLEKEANKINRCRDDRFQIEFRKWWNKIQIPEKDKATNLKDPHIHITMKLNGPKKEIHLLIKAA